MKQSKKCPYCNGKGFKNIGYYNPIFSMTYTTNKEKCIICHGSGIVFENEKENWKIKKMKKLERCSYCNGAGNVLHAPNNKNDKNFIKTCPKCNGKGTIEIQKNES